MKTRVVLLAVGAETDTELIKHEIYKTTFGCESDLRILLKHRGLKEHEFQILTLDELVEMINDNSVIDDIWCSIVYIDE